ncbi:MAG: isochorismate synthase [Actinomycetota bacterium]
MSVGAPPLARRLVSRTVAIEAPADLLDRLPDRGGIAWIRRGEGFVGWGEALRIDPGAGVERFRRAAAGVVAALGRAQADDEVGVWGSGPIAFGSFAFDPRSPQSWLVVPSVVVGSRGGRAWMTLTGVDSLPDPERAQDEPALTIDAFDPPMSEQSYLRAVGAAREAIRWSRLEKVVLSRDVVVDAGAAFDPRTAARRLEARYPECFTFAAGGLVGASPELLVRRVGSSILSVTLGGSARRGVDRADDDRVGRELLGSQKDRHEHDLARESVRSALAPLCADMEVEPEPHLLKLANVQHLGTRVTGRLHVGLTALELAGILHPTAAVCGSPPATALALIRTLEPVDRGRYAGPVGWVDAYGDGEFAIALRCAELRGSHARLLAGAGIVAESDPEAELEETRLKLRAMLSALNGG